MMESTTRNWKKNDESDSRMEEKLKAAMSRREFARRAAIASASAAATASAVASLAAAQTVDGAPSLKSASVNTPPAALASAPGTAVEPSAPSQAQQSAALPKLLPESQAEVDSRIQAIFSQYGSRFSDQQKADIRRLCALAQPSLDRLRAYALENGDNPALYLKPLVEREKKPAAPQSAGSPHPGSASPTSHPANSPADPALASSPTRKTPTASASPASPSAQKNPAAATPAASTAPASPSASQATAPGISKTPPAGTAKKP
jgi:hypothetical protein